MAKTCPVDKLAATVNEVLEEYKSDIRGNLDLITKKMGAEGAKATRAQARKTLKKRTGEYAKGWKYQYRETRFTSEVTIYNDHYSLPHLLEHGHVTRNGTGRTFPDTPAHPHIAPVEEQLVDTYQREVIEKL